MKHVTFPMTYAYPIRLHMPSITLATPAEHTPRIWRDAYTRAGNFLPQATPRLLAGTLIVTSPRSGRTYHCTRTRCDCPSCTVHTAPPPCWPRAAAHLIRTYWDACKPLGRCPVCCGPSINASTWAGEACATCLVCGYEVMADCLAVLDPWPEPPAATALGQRIGRERLRAQVA